MLSLGAAPRACVLAAGLIASGCAVELAGTGPQSVAVLDAGGVPGLTGTNVPPFPDAGSAFDASEPHDGASGQVIIDATLPHDRGCNLDGRFALRVAFDVNWVGTEFLNVIPVIKEGEGQLSFVVLMELQHGPTAIDARFRNCSVTVPEFVSSLGEHYQARFDNAVWDSASMPVFKGQMQLACDKPGCRFSGDPLVALIGAALSSPDAAWPTSPSGATWPDHDGDGEPGVAAFMLGPTDGNYDYPPVDIFGRRVRDL
ncbi:MAG TPA: hypothetical protein VJU61_20040, partial [Polyangiaceae bacterium]|nr:hypothetical protein [Polyangiaceae bacterium]